MFLFYFSLTKINYYMKKIIIISAALALCACNVNFGGCHAFKDRHGEKMLDKMFLDNDFDKNGKISQQEWSKLNKTRFSEIDANNDKNLTKEEMKSFHEKKMKDKR